MISIATNGTHHYQRWGGKLNRSRWAWLAMVAAGVRLAMKERKTRSLIWTTSLIVIAASTVLYLVSMLEQVVGTDVARSIKDFLKVFLQVDLSGVSRIGEYREVLWQALFMLIIKGEMIWVLLIVSLVGPRLISQDLKHNALPIYFAKPVTPLTYIIGKWLVVAVFIALVSMAPNLVSLIVSVLVTGGLHTWGQTLGLGLDLFVSGAMLCMVGGAIILALSSLSSDHRYVTVAWLAICLLSVISQTILNALLPPDSTTGWLGCVSLRENALTVTDWLLGLGRSIESSQLRDEALAGAMGTRVNPACAASVLAGWTVCGAAICYRRVVKFSQSAASM